MYLYMCIYILHFTGVVFEIRIKTIKLEGILKKIMTFKRKEFTTVIKEYYNNAFALC